MSAQNLPKKEMPEELFKYCDLNGLKILQNLEIKVTPPSELNDPFEFTFGLNHVIGLQTKSSTPQKVEEIKEELNKEFRLLCLGENYDSLLMWSHYGFQHRGLVIGFRTSLLAKHLQKKIFDVTYDRLEIPVLSVQWSDQKTPIPNPDQAINALSAKAPQWIYEAEWRIIFLTDECTCKAVDEKGSGLWVCKIDAQAISQVIIGAAANPTMETNIRSILDQNPELSHVKLFKAKKHPTLFQIGEPDELPR